MSMMLETRLKEYIAVFPIVVEFCEGVRDVVIHLHRYRLTIIHRSCHVTMLRSNIHLFNTT